jgi:hypothetical protein
MMASADEFGNFESSRFCAFDDSLAGSTNPPVFREPKTPKP